MKDFYCTQIISQKTKVNTIYETPLVMAFHHTNPYWEQHIVIIPKQHIEGLPDYPNTDELNRDLFEAMKVVTGMLEEQFGGCRICSNVGDYQSTKHLHFYVHAGKRLRAEDGSPIES